MKRLFTFISFLLLIISSIKAQWVWEYEYNYGKTEIPDWYYKINGNIRKVGILPFIGYSYLEEGIARRIESEIRAKLISTNFFKLIEREYLAEIVREQHIRVDNLGRNDVQIIKKYTGADLLIVGTVDRYSQEEIFLQHVSGNYASGDKYKRFVSLSFSFRIINVANGDIVFEKPLNSEYSSIGFKNVIERRSNYNSNQSLGNNLLQALGEELTAELEVSGQLESYNNLIESCLNNIINTCYSELVPLKDKYYEQWQYNRKRDKYRNDTKKYMGKVVDEDILNKMNK